MASTKNRKRSGSRSKVAFRQKSPGNRRAGTRKPTRRTRKTAAQRRLEQNLQTARRVVMAFALVLVVFVGGVIQLFGGRYGVPTWNEVYHWLGLELPTPVEIPEGSTAVTFVDVGQGDAVLIQQGETTCLIDAGTADAADDLLETLRGQGITRLDLLVLTHPHADHMGGMNAVLQNLSVETLLVPDFEALGLQSTAIMRLLTTAQGQGTTIEIAETGQNRPLGDGTLKVLSGGLVPQSDDSGAANNTSLCLLYTFGNFRFLDTGDAEQRGEQALVDQYGSALRATLFKAGHHGSKTSNTEDLLWAVQPQAVGVSCGYRNDYGHPHAEVLERYGDFNIEVHRTDLEGSLTYLWDGEALSVAASGKAEWDRAA